MNLLFEDMIRCEAGGLVCRIWRQVDGPPSFFSNGDLKAKAMDLIYSGRNLQTIAQVLIEYERVNSVEVTDRASGNGICVHKDWP